MSKRRSILALFVCIDPESPPPPSPGPSSPGEPSSPASSPPVDASCGAPGPASGPGTPIPTRPSGPASTVGIGASAVPPHPQTSAKPAQTAASAMTIRVLRSIGCLQGGKRLFPMATPLQERHSARRPSPFMKPCPIPGHLAGLRVGRVRTARGGFGTSQGSAPALLDAVVRIVRHLQSRLAIEDVSERELPRRAVGARVFERTILELAGEPRVELGLHAFGRLAT